MTPAEIEETGSQKRQASSELLEKKSKWQTARTL